MYDSVLGPIVYVAARWPHREHARVLADGLRTEGAVVNSRWLDAAEEEAATSEQRRTWAERDMQDRAWVDAVVLYNPLSAANRGTGGCHWECGYAHALFKPIVVVGGYSNIFHDLEGCLLAAGAKSAMRAVQILLPRAQEKLLAYAHELEQRRKATVRAAREEKRARRGVEKLLDETPRPKWRKALGLDQG